MKCLLDTNICIYLIKTRPDQVLRRFREYAVGEIGVSSLTVAELQYGVWKSQHREQNQRALSQFLIPLLIIDFDEQAASVYGKVRATLEAQGTPVGSLDTLIAAHALSLGVTLVTNNVREFSRVPELKLENWVG